jgi:hypothetical protein
MMNVVVLQSARVGTSAYLMVTWKRREVVFGEVTWY